jgi:hypothetical protein
MLVLSEGGKKGGYQEVGGPAPHAERDLELPA